MTAIASWIFTAIVAGLIFFQIALALGAPLGRFTFGGAQVRLPARCRLGSLVSFSIYGVCAANVLDRTGVVDRVSDDVSKIGAWAVAAFLTLGVALNAIKVRLNVSQSPRGRWTSAGRK